MCKKYNANSNKMCIQYITVSTEQDLYTITSLPCSSFFLK